MELNFQYKQYELNNSKEEKNEEVKPIKPHQEILEYLEKNRTIFSYKDFYNVVKNVQGLLELTLSDGTIVKLVVREGIVNMGLMYPDKSKFMATWSNIVDDKEFLKKCQNLQQA